MSNQVFILSGCRTPVGKFQGQFDKISEFELGSIVISDSLRRSTLNPQDVGQIIMGQVLTAGKGQNPARQAAIKAGIPNTVPAYTINMVCGSGLKSVHLAYQSIRTGDCEIIVAGGQENMSRAHHSAYIRGTKLGALQLNDTIISDGLTDAFNNIHMAETVEHLVKEYNITREAQDKFAVESQTKAQEAIQRGYFSREIVSVVDNKTKQVIHKDEFPKFNTTLEGLSRLKSGFIANGTITAGNASGINDGAAVLVLCSEKQMKLRNLKPLAKIIAFSEVGVDPMYMGLGPVEAVKQVLVKAGWSKDEVDLYELNEAFAAQSILVIEALQVEKSKVNITGGAIALGHPMGASGARILVTLLYNLERLDKKKGVAALCVGGGMGIAVAIEMS